MQEVFTILLWVCSVLLIVSGIDDVMVDLLYWFNRWKYRRSLPNMDDVLAVNENNIALVICAWREYKVIGRTLTYALSKLRYSNFTIFIGYIPTIPKRLRLLKGLRKRITKSLSALTPTTVPPQKRTT